MVNLKIDWRVPKAACLVKLKRDKDKSVDFLPVRFCDVSEALGRERGERHNKSPLTQRARRWRRMTREGGDAASWGSLTSSPQHLYHKSPQRVHGSLWWAGVGSIRKSHRLSGSMCFSYFTADSFPFCRPHSQQPLRIISSNLSLPRWEAIFK